MATSSWGTVWKPVACDLMSISPKLAHSTPSGPWAATHERLRIQPDVLQHLMGACEYQLKFVVAKPEDMQEIERLARHLAADRCHRVRRPLLLKQELQPELDLPAHRLRVRQLAESRIADRQRGRACAGQLKGRRVAQIECLGTKLQGRFLGGPELFEKREIEVSRAGSAQDRPACIPVGLHRRAAKIGNSRGSGRSFRSY